VDNGSTDGTREYLKSLKRKGVTNAVRVILVFNRYNYGVGGGKNSGIIQARGDYVMAIDNDILVPSGYDRKLINACDKIKNLGMIGVSVEKHNYPLVKKNGVTIQLKSDNIGGGCICIPRKVLGRVGYFSSDFVYGGEDCDMYLRMRYIKHINGYILDKGVHLGAADAKEQYKVEAHSSDSAQVKKVASDIERYVKRGSVYVPYSVPPRFK